METTDEKTLQTIAAKVTEDIERRGGFAVKTGVFIATEEAERTQVKNGIKALLNNPKNALYTIRYSIEEAMATGFMIGLAVGKHHQERQRRQ